MDPALRLLDYIDFYENAPKDDALWDDAQRLHLNAVRDLIELVDRTEQDFDSDYVHEFDGMFEEAWKFIGTAAQGRRAVFDRSYRPSLALLGQSVRRKSDELSLTSDRLQDLREALEEIRKTVNVTLGFSDDMAQRINKLIDEVFRIFDADTPNFTRARSLSDEIVGAGMQVVALQEPGEDRVKFFNTLLRVSGNWVSSASAGGVAGIGAAFVIGQLGI